MNDPLHDPEVREQIMKETAPPGKQSLHDKAAETAVLAHEVEKQLRPSRKMASAGDVFRDAERRLKMDRSDIYRSPVFILLAAALAVILVLAATVAVAFVVTGSGFNQLRDVRSCDREFYAATEIAKSNMLAAIGVAEATILDALNEVAADDDAGLEEALKPAPTIVQDLQTFASDLRASVASLDASVESCTKDPSESPSSTVTLPPEGTQP